MSLNIKYMYILLILAKSSFKLQLITGKIKYSIFTTVRHIYNILPLLPGFNI